jgi:hypothetical protein
VHESRRVAFSRLRTRGNAENARHPGLRRYFVHNIVQHTPQNHNKKDIFRPCLKSLPYCCILLLYVPALLPLKRLLIIVLVTWKVTRIFIASTDRWYVLPGYSLDIRMYTDDTSGYTCASICIISQQTFYSWSVRSFRIVRTTIRSTVVH